MIGCHCIATREACLAYIILIIYNIISKRVETLYQLISKNYNVVYQLKSQHPCFEGWPLQKFPQFSLLWHSLSVHTIPCQPTLSTLLNHLTCKISLTSPSLLLSYAIDKVFLVHSHHIPEASDTTPPIQPLHNPQLSVVMHILNLIHAFIAFTTPS